ncbi:MAG TPA: YwqJ-related putative deaminase [Pseudonocardiaceae bacterium]|nr:YwqJ-related putative deaminase [Pseudonocardiaceae bacterium]
MPDRWIRACGVDEGHAAPLHHPLVRQFIETLPPERRPERRAEAAAMSDALHTEDAVRAAAGWPPITLGQARNRLFVNAAVLTYRLRGPGGQAGGERVPPCPSCGLLIRHFSYEANPADNVENLNNDLRLLADWDRSRTGHGGPAAADLDAAIAAFRRLRQDGPALQIRELGTDRLFEALVRRFREKGNVADLDDVIEMHGVDTHRIARQRTRSGPRRRAPGEKWVEKAYRERAKIVNSSVDHTIAATLRWYSPQSGSDESAFDINYVTAPDGYTVRAANARSRSQPMGDLAAETERVIAGLRA